MVRKNIMAISGMLLFVGGAMAHASTPATSNLKANSGLHTEATAATPARIAHPGAFPTVVGQPMIVTDAVPGASLSQAQGHSGFRYHGAGGPRRSESNDALADSRADVLFDN
ncbi:MULTISPECIES: hypothetical protein [Sorangium]|nr:hypothetical protein [Sorangium cellulosum]